MVGGLYSHFSWYKSETRYFYQALCLIQAMYEEKEKEEEEEETIVHWHRQGVTLSFFGQRGRCFIFNLKLRVPWRAWLPPYKVTYIRNEYRIVGMYVRMYLYVTRFSSISHFYSRIIFDLERVISFPTSCWFILFFLYFSSFFLHFYFFPFFLFLYTSSSFLS